MEATNENAIKPRRIHVSMPNFTRIGRRSPGALKTDAVRKARKAPSMVRSI